MAKQKKKAAQATIKGEDQRPEVSIRIRTDEHPNAIRIEILISGDNPATRDNVAKAVKMVLNDVFGSSVSTDDDRSN